MLSDDLAQTLTESADPVGDTTISMDRARKEILVAASSNVRPAPSQAKPRFAEFSCSHNDVTAYVKKCVMNVVPLEIFGSENVKLVHTRVVIYFCCAYVLDAHYFHIDIDAFVRARRSETFSIHQLMQGIKLSTVEWLNAATDRGRPTVTHARKRVVLYGDMMRWLFDEFITAVLQVRLPLVYLRQEAEVRRRGPFTLQSLLLCSGRRCISGRATGEQCVHLSSNNWLIDTSRS